MPKQTYTQTSFSHGMVSLPIFVRSDLEAQSNGLMTLENAYVTPTGGIKRREGTRFIDTLLGKSRLINFGAAKQEVLVVLSNLKIAIYEEDVKVFEATSPWRENEIQHVQWTQNVDTLFLVHPDFAPKKLRKAKNVWQFQNWIFQTNIDGLTLDPFYKFDDTEGVLLTPLGTSGTFIVNVSTQYFSEEHIGLKIRLNDGEMIITQVIDDSSIQVQSSKDLISLDQSSDWIESCFSDQRGWPISISFHQNRLVVGGSKSLPHKVWMSKTGDFFNFDFGEGLDDEAITFSLLSDQREHISSVFSGTHLQVLTAQSEWMVGGEPLTPATINVKKQTTIGSHLDRYLPPQNVEGATIFIAKNGKEIREFIYGEVEKTYQSYDLALLAGHLMETPVDQTYNDENRKLYVVMETGNMAVLVLNKSVGVAGWSVYKTQGNFQSIAIVNGQTYISVARATGVFLEKFDERVHLDSSISTKDANVVILPHLNNQNSGWTGDDFRSGEDVVQDNNLGLPEIMETTDAGLNYTHVIEPLPILNLNGEVAKKWRLIELRLSLKKSHLLELSMQDETHTVQLDEDVFTGSYRLKALGYIEDLTTSLWKIESNKPYAFEFLGYTAFIKTI
ncbi:MAG: hypothetical protein JXQ74_02630 [Alphaproteobacteria bacterium]|nr:hypothetical protein [Alphaproteobacteria bacterium]